MGYYAQITAANLVIPAANFESARQALITQGHTGWANDEESAQLPSLLTANDFDIEIDTDGSLWIEGFDNKWREHGKIVSTLGRFAQGDWFVQWVGEDNEAWRQDGKGEHSISQIVSSDLFTLQADADKMRALLARAVFPSEQDAMEAGRFTGTPSLFGLFDPKTNAHIVTGLDEQIVNSVRMHVIGR